MKSFTDGIEKITKFARLERILGIVCIVAPGLMYLADTGAKGFRNSISAYYDMGNAMMFYVPLTVAFMLFVTNGVVKKGKFYNTMLGIMLAGVVLFNHDDFAVPHAIFAIGFFVGNGVAMVLYTSKKELWFKVVLVAIIVATLAAWLTGPLTLFWAEWISLFIIGGHYILEASGLID